VNYRFDPIFVARALVCPFLLPLLELTTTSFIALHNYHRLSESICVVTSDGRIILGELVGHDQVQNLILNDAKERVYSSGSPPDTVDLGLYVIRGDNVCMIADYNEDLWTDEAVAPIAAVRQQEKI